MYNGAQLYTKNSDGTYSAYTGTLYTRVYIGYIKKQGANNIVSSTDKVTYKASDHSTTTAKVLAK